MGYRGDWTLLVAVRRVIVGISLRWTSALVHHVRERVIDPHVGLDGGDDSDRDCLSHSDAKRVESHDVSHLRNTDPVRKWP